MQNKNDQDQNDLSQRLSTRESEVKTNDIAEVETEVDSNKTASWQMDVEEFEKNGCLINSD